MRAIFRTADGIESLEDIGPEPRIKIQRAITPTVRSFFGKNNDLTEFPSYTYREYELRGVANGYAFYLEIYKAE
jgi:hypothetical protein